MSWEWSIAFVSIEKICLLYIKGYNMIKNVFLIVATGNRLVLVILLLVVSTSTTGSKYYYYYY